ncbi:MAG: hypothetical protein WAO08_33575 [Hyphomicrobiaceae bacterium]
MSNRFAVVDQRHGAKLLASNHRGRGNDRNSVIHGGQFNERVSGNAFQQHVRSNLRDLASGIKPSSRPVVALHQQYRLTSEFRNLNDSALAQAVGFRQHDQHVNWKQQAPGEASVDGRHDRQMNFATLEAAPLASNAAFNEQNLNIGMTPPVSQ